MTILQALKGRSASIQDQKMGDTAKGRLLFVHLGIPQGCAAASVCQVCRGAET
ncbi:hypothetical protein PXK05_12830 [Phaeobacter gallaeciensis]|jgi:hypothetical protein|uniref:hypothetical protein n=1 Tax=Phaeobacter gallaeciensis TaxID=60890 RepID=UPI00237EF781|nr:hypothetical protein [Phaeobacter gallaeciensis]MDE4120442.1 hypothetical protein [Phaeobacter gallaeciensis]MDE4229329.1 hypothetical protein [Phaeobacter gallaeciensis]MDE4266831.1 hypothetical protein [Phaeobacter gallaeciensis]